MAAQNMFVMVQYIVKNSKRFNLRLLLLVLTKEKKNRVNISHYQKATQPRTVHQLRRMVDDPFDLTLILQMPDSNPRKTAIDFKPLNEDTLADELEAWDFLQNTVVGRFIERNSVHRLILDLSLRPLLLLGSFTAR
jgi:hypothetical protein